MAGYGPRGSGYNNEAYCSQYDQYEYETCNNGNIETDFYKKAVNRDMYDSGNVDGDFYNPPISRHELFNDSYECGDVILKPTRYREQPIGAISTLQYVEQHSGVIVRQSQAPMSAGYRPISPERRTRSPERRAISPGYRQLSPERRAISPERRVISPVVNRRAKPAALSPMQSRRHTIIVSPQPPRTPQHHATSPTASRRPVPVPPRRQNTENLLQRDAAALSTSFSYSCTTSTPNKRYGDANTSLLATSPVRRNMFQTPPHRTAVISPNTYCKAPTISPLGLKPDPDSPSKASWIFAPTYQKPPRSTLATAALFLGVCGAVTCFLGLYMLAEDGRKYYLDFGFLSGVSSLLLGCLGFRARRWEWLPNRNYVSGYVMVALFSLMTCGCLITMTALHLKPGTPLADVAGGAVCAVSVLSLVLAALGVVTTHCCRYPPPDNRVEHCAEGFTL